MLHGFARLAFFAGRTAKPLSDYRIRNRELGMGSRELVGLPHFSTILLEGCRLTSLRLPASLTVCFKTTELHCCCAGLEEIETEFRDKL